MKKETIVKVITTALILVILACAWFALVEKTKAVMSTNPDEGQFSARIVDITETGQLEARFIVSGKNNHVTSVWLNSKHPKEYKIGDIVVVTITECEIEKL